MSQEAGHPGYDDLLTKARGSAKYWVPQLCEALRKENPEMTPNDIRDTIKKDCISIWQRGTITDALPDEYKDKTRQKVGRKGRQKQLAQENTSGGTVTTTEDLPDSNRAKPVSDTQSEQYFGDDNSSTPNLKNELEEVKEENRKLRQTIAIQKSEKPLYDGGGIFDIKDMPIINGKPKVSLESVIRTYNNIISNLIKNREVVPLKQYVVTRTGLLVPITLYIRFRDKYAGIRLDRQRQLFYMTMQNPRSANAND
jgi:hypothetical protein